MVGADKHWFAEADDFSVEVRRLRPEDVGPASRTGGG
jgi:hypothetical protein